MMRVKKPLNLGRVATSSTTIPQVFITEVRESDAVHEEASPPSDPFLPNQINCVFVALSSNLTSLSDEIYIYDSLEGLLESSSQLVTISLLMNPRSCLVLEV